MGATESTLKEVTDIKGKFSESEVQNLIKLYKSIGNDAGKLDSNGSSAKKLQKALPLYSLTLCTEIINAILKDAPTCICSATSLEAAGGNDKVSNMV